MAVPQLRRPQYPDATSTLGAGVQGIGEGIASFFTSIPGLLSALRDPQKRAELKKAFSTATPEGKQRLLTMAGELVGGGAGSAAGVGILSVPAAGAGAVLGKLAAEEMGRLFGLPQDWQKQTGAETARDLGRTFGGNAAGEGFGRALPAVKEGGKNLAKLPFQPTPAVAKTNAAADALGVPLTLAARSGGPRISQLQAALSHHWTAGPVIQKANQEGLAALERSYEQLFSQINPTQVSREELTNMLQQSLAKARQTADAKIAGQLDLIAGSLAPASKTAQEVGRGLQGGLAANAKRLSGFATQAYRKLDEMGAAVMVPFDSVVDIAERMIGDHPDLIHYLPGEVKSLLKRTADLRRGAPEELNSLAMNQAGVAYADLDAGQRAIVDSIAKRLGIDTTIPTGVEIPYPTAQRIKAQLGEMRSGLEVLDNPAKKHAFAAIANEADDVLRTKIPDPNLQNLYNDVTQKFAKGAQATREPAVAGKFGNPMAKTIREAAAPEDIPNRLTQPYGATEIQQARKATSPQSMAHLEPNSVPPGAAEPMADAERYAVENMRKRATVSTTEGGQRVSPKLLREQSHGVGAEDTNRELLGSRLEDPSATQPRLSLGETANPEALVTEQRLHSSPLSRALDDPQDRANRVMNAAFPPRAAGAANTTLDLAGGAGLPVAQRALADDLLRQSTTETEARAAGFGDKGSIDPAKLRKKIADYGETLDATLDPATIQGMEERIAVGEARAAPHKLYGNFSRTAPTHQIMRGVNNASKGIATILTGEGALHPAHAVTAGVGAAAVMGLPYLLAKGMTSQPLAKGLTAPLGAMTITDKAVSGLGTAARVPYIINEKAKKGDDSIPPYAQVLADDSIPDYATRQ